MGGVAGERDRGARNAWWLMSALAALAVGAVMVSEFRSAWAEAAAYRAAPVCTTAPVGAEDCRWRETFTVRSVDLHRGSKSESPETELRLSSGESRRVVFPNANPVVSGLEPHDKVVAVVWRGAVVDVRDTDGAHQETRESPVGWSTDRLGGALAFLSFGAAALVGGLWSTFARDRRHDEAGRMVCLHGIGLGATALLILWTQSANEWPARTLPIAWAVVATLILANTVGFVRAALRGQIGAGEA